MSESAKSSEDPGTRVRPLSISIIGWYLIIASGLGLLGFFVALTNEQTQQLMEQSSIPVPAQLVMSLIGIAVSGTSGYFILQGAAWARLLYVGWTLLGFAISLVSSPLRLLLLPGIAVFLLVTFFLFTSKANAWFAEGPRA